MAIVALKKIELIGHRDDKEAVLEELQRLGCLHLIPAHPEWSEPVTTPVPRVREALSFLRATPRWRRQVTDAQKLDGPAVLEQTLDVKHRLQDLQDEHDFLTGRIDSLAAWGDFELPPLDELGGNRLWFYIVPNHTVRRLQAADVPWTVVHRSARHSYVVALSPEEPHDMPVERVRTGARPRHALEERLEQVEIAIEDAEAERASLTRWCTLIGDALLRLEDRADRIAAMQQTWDEGPLFALTGFAPHDRIDELRAYAQQRHMALRVGDARAEDEPPTLLRNPPALEPGQDLVTFYMTPGYFTWDPSGVVLFSFALFFGMILSDAGYAGLLGVAVALYWDAMGRSSVGARLRWVCGACVGAGVVYGMLMGSYFGVTPRPGSLLSVFKIADLTDSSLMMPLTVAIGGAHVLVANLLEARRLGVGAPALAPLGWATLVVGMMLWGAAIPWPGSSAILAPSGQGMIAAGAALVLVFSAPGEPIGRRLLGGLTSLARLSAIFGDVLSYLRLFALGLASASLATAFNDLAHRVQVSLGGAGIVAAVAILLVGHGLNLILAVMGGVVHGLRLNAIEFFNWSLHEEGRPFRAFRRKEKATWNP